jgi:hypothetical protein
VIESTSVIAVPAGSRPKKLAPVMLVVVVVRKSSADSISSVPAVPGREAVPRRPSGLPVLNVNRSASAGGADTRPSTADATTSERRIVGMAPSLAPDSPLGATCIPSVDFAAQSAR